MEENKSPWIRWSERKPEEGMYIVVVQYPTPEIGGYGFRYFVVYPNSLVTCKGFLKEIDSMYWLELPK